MQAFVQLKMAALLPTKIYLFPDSAITAPQGGAGFIDKGQFQIGFLEFADEFTQGVEGAADLAVEVNFGVALGSGGDGDRILVNIEADV